MNAIAARWQPEEVRLWAGSACAALLVHLVAAALLFVRIQSRPRPSPLAGSPVALNVELASPSSSTASASSVSLGSSLPSRRQQSLSKRPGVTSSSPLQPLARMQPLAQEVASAPSDMPLPAAARATGPTPELSPLAASQPTALPQTQGQVDVPQSPEQQWFAEVNAQLARYKQYPSSAVQNLQQDTVTLRFAVDRSGRVTYFRIDSSQHYPALEQEVQHMLQAAPLPAPPPEVPVDNIVVNVPVDFYLTSSPHSPALADCATSQDPGAAPAAATATLQQMRAYRARLEQYVAAVGTELDCLGKVPEVAAQVSRSTLSRQLRGLVDDFNARARLFEARAQAEALQAQQAHQRQLQADAARVYADCAPPVAPSAPASVTADTAQSYRRDLLGYQKGVRAYLACIHEAQLLATEPARALASDQRAQIYRTATQLGDAAILPFNQLVAGFNAQVPRLRQALAAQTERNLAEVVARAAAVFPDSTWSVPAPLPTDECFRIARAGETYRAQLCNSTYVTRINPNVQLAQGNGIPANTGSTGAQFAQMQGTGSGDAPGDAAIAQATQQESIAAIHGVGGGAFCPTGANCPPPVLGIAVAPVFEQGQQTGTDLQTIYYAVSDLQVAGRHLALTISRRSPGTAPGEDWSAVHFDLVLSPDNQTLHGYCWIDQRRWECTLPLHH